MQNSWNFIFGLFLFPKDGEIHFSFRINELEYLKCLSGG